MYSAILLVAMSQGVEMPVARCHGGHRGCHSSCGHRGGRHGGCHGGGGGGGYCGGYGGCGGGACYGGGGAYHAAIDAEAPITIVVNLPEDAKLTIDDNPTTSTSARRTFVSPAAAIGLDYTYTLKAEVKRDGKPVRIEKTVTVRAGEENLVTLDLPTSVAAR
jgi:uncharacterized protein (TIGR03000 family)